MITYLLALLLDFRRGDVDLLDLGVADLVVHLLAVVGPDLGAAHSHLAIAVLSLLRNLHTKCIKSQFV